MDINQNITCEKLCLGVFREAEHSPDRVQDDELILKAVGRRLQEDWHLEVKLVYPSDLQQVLDSRMPALIFNMAEEMPVLSMLQKYEERGGKVVNTPEGIRNTFREQMTSILSGMSAFPETSFCCVTDTLVPIEGSVWVKRGDFHAIEREDVMFAGDASELSEVMDSFAQRGIETVAIQKHVPGDLIKFYGVRHHGKFQAGDANVTLWFHWFYHRDQDLKNYTFDAGALQACCEESADRLGLEIFGGDAIVTEQGEIYVIDVNAWPSFALFRDEASGHIAAHLAKELF